MSHRPSARSSRPVVGWRFAACGLVAALAAAGAATVGSSFGSHAGQQTPVTRRATLVVTAAGRPVTRVTLGLGQPVNARVLRAALVEKLPDGVTATRGRASIGYRYDVDLTVRRAVALGPAGGRLDAARVPRSSRIRAPAVRQAQANTCESAALEILLATSGTRIAQRRLQAAFPASGSLDPVGTGPSRVWGDPDKGYVGRADGSGVAGGFGIYPRPAAAAARKLGRKLDDLTGSDARRIYARLLRGRAVMTWIGLSAGPYGEWESPDGKRIKVNFGEHTIVLAGMDPAGRLRVVNPLRGTQELWSQTRFEAAWMLLGRRALGV